MGTIVGSNVGLSSLCEGFMLGWLDESSEGRELECVVGF